MRQVHAAETAVAVGEWRRAWSSALTAHFVAAARAAAPLPFYCYAFAPRSGYPLPVEVIRRIAASVDNLAGLKVSESPFERVEPYLELGLPVLIGNEPLLPAGIARGAIGTVSGMITTFRLMTLFGAGDWNDGLSAAGLEEKGESLWLAHFLAGCLGDWAEIHERSGRAKFASDYAARRERLVKAINEHGWDGEWYWRATLDDGIVVFLIGMRINTWWKIHRWLPVARAMSPMMKELLHNPESGLLGATFAFTMGDLLMVLGLLYLLHTTGELCLSPVGLSAVTKLAPLWVKA